MATGDYTTVSTLHTVLDIPSTDTSLDAFYAIQIMDASRLIDLWTRNQFYATTETRYYDYEEPFKLWLDKRILSVTAFTNGDGQTIKVDTSATRSTATEALLYPLNSPSGSYTRIELLRNVGRILFFEGTPQGAISVAGSWGYSATPPQDIVSATNKLIAYVTTELDVRGINRREQDTYREFFVNFMSELKEPPSTIAPIVKRYTFTRLFNAQPHTEFNFYGG